MAENQNQSPGTEEQYPDNRLTEPSIGLVYDKAKDRAEVFSQNPDGSLGTVDPIPENESMFFLMDQSIPANFYKNLQKYHNNPSVNIYVFPRRALDRIKDALTRYRKNTTSDDVKVLYNYKMRPNGEYECNVKTHGIRDNEMPWDVLNRFGLNYGILERTGNLQRLRNYEPTNMLKITYSDNIISNMVGDAKLRLRGKGDNVKLSLKFHTRTPAKQLFGVPFTDEDLKNLATTGNLGRVFATPEGPLLVSRDFDTQQYDWVKPEQAYIPDKLYGHKLSQEEIDAFRNGEAHVVPTKTTTGELRNLPYQYNAVFRKVMQVLTREQRNELANELRNKNDMERIISNPSQEASARNEQQQAAQTPTEQPRQTQNQVTEQQSAQVKGQAATARKQATEQKPAPRPQVKAAEPAKGVRTGKHL